jgi:hypothetical protein
VPKKNSTNIIWPNNISNEKLRKGTKSKTIEDELKTRTDTSSGRITATTQR